MSKISPEQIDALLPQTQCGLCGYNGCMPYAEAIIDEQAPINQCPPGGVSTLQQLGLLLNQETHHLIADMEQKTKPNKFAVIREDECIGCTKCIQACPVDAILGSAKLMHTVITAECTGCELCIAPCPVDCIDMEMLVNQVERQVKPDHARKRYHARNARLQNQKIMKKKNQQILSIDSKKKYIEAAKARVKAKKN